MSCSCLSIGGTSKDFLRVVFVSWLARRPLKCEATTGPKSKLLKLLLDLFETFRFDTGILY